MGNESQVARLVFGLPLHRQPLGPAAGIKIFIVEPDAQAFAREQARGLAEVMDIPRILYPALRPGDIDDGAPGLVGQQLVERRKCTVWRGFAKLDLGAHRGQHFGCPSITCVRRGKLVVHVVGPVLGRGIGELWTVHKCALIFRAFAEDRR